MRASPPLLLALAAPARAADTTVRLNDGSRMPTVSLGTAATDYNVTAAAVVDAFRAGFRSVDTALIYENQGGIGDGIRTAMSAEGLSRYEVHVTTKVPGCSLGTIGCGDETAAMHAENLHLLKLDYVDLLLVHWPGSLNCKHDRQCRNIRRQWGELAKLRDANKTRSIGVSNFCQACLECIAEDPSLPTPAVNQFQYHVGEGADPDGLVSYCKANSIVVQAFSPLGPTFNQSAKDVLIKGNLTTGIGAAHNKSGAQVALRWVAQHGAAVVTRATNAQYLAEDIDLFSWGLTDEEMARLDAATVPSAGIVRPSVVCSL